jgi:hypothetical protein
MYYDPKIGYFGINDLSRKSGISQKMVKEFLDTLDNYTLHKKKNVSNEESKC